VKEAATYLLRLRSLTGDNLHGLRALLKELGRRHKFKCLSAAEEAPQSFEPPEFEEAAGTSGINEDCKT
jgi:hypothetical protein